MVTHVLAGPLGELRAASSADGGTALTTANAYIPLPNGTKHIIVMPRNFATAVVAKIALCPYLYVVKTVTDGASGTDYSDAAQDGSASTDVVLSSLSTALSLDYLFVGSWVPFAGVQCDIDGPNSNVSALTVNYWQSDGLGSGTWADITATDGTDAGGVTFAQDGAVTWTVPTDWLPSSLREAHAGSGSMPAANAAGIFWTRWEVSAAMDAATTINSMAAVPNGTPSEWVAGAVIESSYEKGPGGWAYVQAKTNAGTANLIVNVAAAPNFRFV